MNLTEGDFAALLSFLVENASLLGGEVGVEDVEVGFVVEREGEVVDVGRADVLQVIGDGGLGHAAGEGCENDEEEENATGYGVARGHGWMVRGGVEIWERALLFFGGG